MSTVQWSGILSLGVLVGCGSAEPVASKTPDDLLASINGSSKVAAMQQELAALGCDATAIHFDGEVSKLSPDLGWVSFVAVPATCSDKTRAAIMEVLTGPDLEVIVVTATAFDIGDEPYPINVVGYAIGLDDHLTVQDGQAEMEAKWPVIFSSALQAAVGPAAAASIDVSAGPGKPSTGGIASLAGGDSGGEPRPGNDAADGFDCGASGTCADCMANKATYNVNSNPLHSLFNSGTCGGGGAVLGGITGLSLGIAGGVCVAATLGTCAIAIAGGAIVVGTLGYYGCKVAFETGSVSPGDQDFCASTCPGQCAAAPCHSDADCVNKIPNPAYDPNATPPGPQFIDGKCARGPAGGASYFMCVPK